MRLVVPGSSGLLGINLAQEAMTAHQVTGVDRGKLVHAPFRNIKQDLLNPDAVEDILDLAKPDWLINCAALANLEACEADPKLACLLNIDLPGKLAKGCKERGVSFVHISTDAVFDGKKDGIYTEEDIPNPLGTYAKTKLDGEHSVFDANPEAIVARINIYGWSLSGKRSLAEFFYNNLSQNKSVNGFTDVIFCPMLVNHTAQILMKMLEKGLKGLYHLVGVQPMSKYQFGMEIARRFNFQESKVVPKSVRSSELTAYRSHNLRLSIHKLSTDLNEPLPEFSTGLDEFYTQYQQAYPQKIRSYQQL